MKEMTLSIITPDQEVFAGGVTSVTVPGKIGQFQVLFDHAPIVSTLDNGQITVIKADGSEMTIQAEGGVIEVMKNDIKILVERVVESADA